MNGHGNIEGIRNVEKEVNEQTTCISCWMSKKIERSANKNTERSTVDLRDIGILKLFKQEFEQLLDNIYYISICVCACVEDDSLQAM